MSSLKRPEVLVDLDLQAKRLHEAREYLYQRMSENPYDNGLDLPYALLGEVLADIEWEMPNDED